MRRISADLTIPGGKPLYIPAVEIPGCVKMDKKRFQKWTEREYSTNQRIIALILEGILFLIIIPLLLVVASSYIDHWLQIPRFEHGLVASFGLLLMVPGLLFALWSIHVQFTLGKGTPAPFMATQTLVVQGPYIYCRNPMTFGTILLYLGMSIWIGSFSAIGLTLLFTGLLIIYIRAIEEKELETRFGPAYTEYKRNTPFLIPRSPH